MCNCTVRFAPSFGLLEVTMHSHMGVMYDNQLGHYERVSRLLHTALMAVQDDQYAVASCTGCAFVEMQPGNGC